MHGSRLPLHELPNVFVTPHLRAWTGNMIERRMTSTVSLSASLLIASCSKAPGQPEIL